VYRVGHPLPLPFSRELAAVLVASDVATLSHGSAAYAWALAPEPRGAVEITIPPDRRRARTGIRAHRSMLLSADVTQCRGIPTTTPARTLIDLAAAAAPPELERAVEVDGYAFHRGRAAFERDRARDAQLVAAGLRIMRITWRQLADEPEAVVARLAAALAAPGRVLVGESGGGAGCARAERSSAIPGGGVRYARVRRL
jgi:hypothetical protein